MEEREGKNEPIKHGHITQPVRVAWATRGLRAPLAMGPTAHPRLGPHVASWPPSPLACFLTFFSRILGIQTPILNPFLDYKL